MEVRTGLDRFVGWACRGLLSIFFRRIEVVGAERIPESGPYLVVANHLNGLLDPMFVLGPLGIPARMLGKSTLWKIPILAQLADLAGAIPVHRRMDASADPSKNVDVFARCHEELARMGRIALFPEGISHDEPQLQPLKTGAARIAIEAERRFGPLGVRIVPVGLVFQHRERFRSSALAVIGEPIDPAEEVRRAESEEREAVRALTDRIFRALEGVTLNYSSWEEARRVALGTEIYLRERSGGRAPTLAEQVEARQAVARRLGRLRAVHPAEVAEAAEAVGEYEELLRDSGVRDVQVVADYARPLVVSFVSRTLWRLFVAAPFAAVGTVLNVVPYLAARLISNFYDDEPNQVATYKLFPSFLIYPAVWLGWAFVAARFLGTTAGTAVAMAGPLTGWVALRFHEHRRRLWGEARAFLTLKARRGVADELRRRRARVERAIDALLPLVAQADAPPSAPSSRSSRRS